MKNFNIQHSCQQYRIVFNSKHEKKKLKKEKEKEKRVSYVFITMT